MEDFTALSALAAHQHGLLTAAQLLDAGYSHRMVTRRVESGAFTRRARGVIQLAGTRSTWKQELLVAVLAAHPAAASHRSAAHLWDFRTVDEEHEIVVRYPRNVLVEGAIVHRSRDFEDVDRTEVDGIPVTTPERTICDLGLIFPETEVHRILRHAVATNLVTPRDLWNMRMRTSKQGRNGTGVLERVLDALPEQVEFTESGLEIQFLEMCESFSIVAPVPQLPVRVQGRLYRLDFAWIAQRVFVEIDGATYHSSPLQIADDGLRQNRLVSAGWTPVRFTAEDLRVRPAACAHILSDLLDL